MKDCDRLLVLEFLESSLRFCECRFYARASVRGVVYHSKDYTRVSKRNSFTVKFLHKGCVQYGYILWFAHPEHDIISSGFACVQKLEKVKVNYFSRNHENISADVHIIENFMDIRLGHVKMVKVSDELCMVDLKNIVDMCICMAIDNIIDL